MKATPELSSPATPAYSAAQRAARDSYGRLVAWLAYQWRDVAAAEDAMATALLKALELWPLHGVPCAPDAWLLSVAKRELLQTARRQRLFTSPEMQVALQSDDFYISPPTVPDVRLKLLFICAHPAIDASIRPALMLQTVLGLDARYVAQAMLTSPTAMAQRLVRAKQKMKAAGLKFETPEASDLQDRLHAVLEAIYAAYGLGWEAVDGADAANHMSGLRDEALYLIALVCHLLPDSPEALGLHALMLFCEARVPARCTPEHGFAPLSEQDTTLWNRPAIEHAEQLLRNAAALNMPDSFQIEAAIQSAHCQRLFTQTTPWTAIAQLYEMLYCLAPSVGVQVARAMAWAQADELTKARQLLSQLDHNLVKAYQPYWVVYAHLAQLEGDTVSQSKSISIAIGLTSSASVRTYLWAKYTNSKTTA